MIISRLKALLDHYSLTSSVLADSIGVPRSSISHLLSGRNKPSLDFVLKLIKVYPEVDLYWFLLGKGTFPPTSEPILPLETPIDTAAPSKPATIASFDNEKAEEGPTVSQVVIFYEDGTFSAYTPKK
ncbi:MAG: helix-turn-helix transcriptional regulator [Bacteroidota bacterium]